MWLELVLIHLLSAASSRRSIYFLLRTFSRRILPRWNPNVSENMRACGLNIQIYFSQDDRGCCSRREWNVGPQEDFGPLDQTLNQKDLCTQQTNHSWWATSTFAFTLLPHSITHTHTPTCTRIFAKQQAFQKLCLCLCLHFMITEHSSAQKRCFRAARDPRPFHVALHIRRVF